MNQLPDYGEKTGICVLDGEYRVIYLNGGAKTIYPDLKEGMHCYQAICDESRPCHNCPGLDKDLSHKLFYNPACRRWLDLSTAEIEWPGYGNCRLLAFKPVEENEQEASGEGDKLSEKDRLTGLYRYGPFYQKAAELLSRNPDTPFCMVAIDIEHFKLFNEWYGEEAGDRFLINIGKQLKAVEEDSGAIAGYLGGDDFVMIMRKDAAMLERMENEIKNYVRQYGGNAGFLPAFGIYEIGDRSISVSMMYDRASIALASIKGNYAKRTCWYDVRMKEKMEEDQVLLSEVQKGLENREFIFYLQPQCNMMTGKIVGMESLVRWNHPVKGLVYPGEFIPLLERSGFITNLDLYLWEMVCKWLHDRIGAGYQPVPVSVNVSRMDIYSVNVTEVMLALIRKYEIPIKLLEIEITESAYAEDYDLIRRAVAEMREAGFVVFMDDFGSGYSSLNMLKDVNVDVLKIDTKFLEMDEYTRKRGMGILETIVHLAKLMQMRVIAEGVESREHVDILQEMGCFYGQGFYFCRPMPVEKMEELLSDGEMVDYRGILSPRIGEVRLEDLFSQDVTSETMLNNILGGIAIYDVCGDTCELVRVNEGYYKVTGCNPVDLEERRQMIMEQIHKEDRKKVLELFQMAYDNPLSGAEGVVRRHRLSGELMWLQLRVFYLREQDGHRLYYGAVSDVTGQKLQEQKLASSQKVLADMLRLDGTDKNYEEQAEENLWMAGGIFAQMAPGGLIGGYCEEGFPLYFANNEMVRLLGYESYEDFQEGIDGKVANTIHPDDLSQVIKDIGPEYYAGLEYTTRYRMPKKDGTWFWVLDKGRVVQAEDGRLAIASACMDITASVRAHQKLEEANRALQFKNGELEFLSSGVPGGYHRCAFTENFDFLYISERFLYILGYTAKELENEYHNQFKNLFHPEDWERVYRTITEAPENHTFFMVECRLKARKGYIWVRYQAQKAVKEGTQFLYGIILDIDEVVNLRQEVGECRKRLEELENQKRGEADLPGGVYDRKDAVPVVREWIARQRRQKSALVLFHIEGFEKAGEIYGKNGADQYLASYVRQLKGLFREEDIFCRISRLEFLVLCKNIGESDMKRKLKRVREEMKAAVEAERYRTALSVSAVYVMIPDGDAGFDELFKKARTDLDEARARRREENG